MPEKQNEIPSEAFKFESVGEIAFAADDTEKNNFRLTLYNGEIHEHWYWGKMGFDLETMKLAKAKIPVLDHHDRQQRVGVGEKATFDKKFILEGRFLKNPIAQAIRADAIDGFPFECSLFFDSKKTEIDQIGQGQKTEVNGHKFTGPGAIMRNAVIMEGSFVTFGELDKTKAVTFEQLQEQENQNMSDKEMTKTEFAAAHPTIYQEAVSEGEANARAEFGKFCGQFGDDPAFLVEQFKAGASLTDATVAENQKLKAEMAAAAELAAKKPPEKKGETEEKVDPAAQEFSDNQDKKPPVKSEAGDGDPSEKFMGIAREYAKTHECKLSKAVSFCSVSHPTEHQAMLDANTITKTRSGRHR